MWKCPVCDKEDNAETVCPTCGYDRTCDYERYPTAFTVKRHPHPHPAPPVAGAAEPTDNPPTPARSTPDGTARPHRRARQKGERPLEGARSRRGHRLRDRGGKIRSR